MMNFQRQDSCYRVDPQRDQKMIQQLFAGAGNGGVLLGGEIITAPKPPIKETAAALAATAAVSSSSSLLFTSSSSTTSKSSSSSENLKCPRCDSSNTKFCYYNNYNLTQPRHFCKTCRRYWTKGGALRNVPIGGGCRKNKNPIVTTASNSKWKSTYQLVGGLEFPPPPPHHQNNNFVSVLRSNQNPNPSPTLNSSGAEVQVPTLWRNNSNINNSNGFIFANGEAQTAGVQELLCQRLIKSSTNNYANNVDYCCQYPLAFLGNAVSSSSLMSSSLSPAILESAPVAGEFGYPSLSAPWSDLPTTTTTTGGSVYP